MTTATLEKIIFPTKADARRVCSRLRDFSVLSSVVGREVWIQVTVNGADNDRTLALRVFKDRMLALRVFRDNRP